VDTVWSELTGGLWNGVDTIRVAVRLVAAMLLGAVVGFERERAGQWAGLRTHMLVALGAALFVIVPSQVGLGLSDVSRVIQGIATGIGFIGAGSVLKLTGEREIRGLTTAASVWVTAAVGVAVGFGLTGAAAMGVVLAWVVLVVVGRLEARLMAKSAHRNPRAPSAGSSGTDAGENRQMKDAGASA
jgi:putative Mg2+ transporter-C (MgtC) family protein